MATVSSVGGLNRYWGLASGLNVESIVTGLCSDIQSQMDTAKAEQQKLEWKQTAYRDVISSLNAFEDAYLSLNSDDSMMSPDLYTSFAVSSSNGAISATANSECDGLPKSVQIFQSALTASIKGGSISNNKLTGVFDIVSNISTVKTSLKGQSMNMTVDDLTKSISFTDGELDGITDADSFITLFNSKLKDAFGTIGGNARVTASLDGGKIALSGPSGYDSTEISFDGSQGAVDLGLNNLSNRSNLYENLGTFLSQKGVVVDHDSSYSATDDRFYNFTVNFNGKDVTLNSKTMTVNQAITAINSANTGVMLKYDKTLDSISLNATQSGSTGQVNVGTDDNTKSVLKSLGIDMDNSSSYTKQAGRDAIVSINGTKFARASNNFTIDGVSYAINKNVSGTPENADLTFTNDTTNLEKGIKKFIQSYNGLVTKLTKYVMTKPDKDNKYDPLTDKEKEKMTSEQIDKYNAKADDTILYNDASLYGVLDSMREALYKPVTLSDGSTMSLYDIGITTSDDVNNMGTIEIKSAKDGKYADDATKFKNALATKTSQIAEFFTKQSSILLKNYTDNDADKAKQTQRTNEEGLLMRIDDIVKRNTAEIFGHKGILLEIAGTETSATTDNFLYKQLSDTKDKINEIKERLQTKQDKLFAQFQDLETYMSQANTQSSMLSNMLGSR